MPICFNGFSVPAIRSFRWNFFFALYFSLKKFLQFFLTFFSLLTSGHFNLEIRNLIQRFFYQILVGYFQPIFSKVLLKKKFQKSSDLSDIFGILIYKTHLFEQIRTVLIIIIIRLYGMSHLSRQRYIRIPIQNIKECFKLGMEW